LDSFKFSKSNHKLFSKQLEKIIDVEMSGLSEKIRILKTEIADLQKQYDKMEIRYATGELSEELNTKIDVYNSKQSKERKKVLQGKDY